MEIFHSCSLLLLSLLISNVLFSAVVSSIGINYGQIANNLPTPDKVIPLLKTVGASKVKLYDADARVLKAFANSGVEFAIGLGNEFLSKIADDQSAADAWVKTNVEAYLPATKVTCITVGNEVLTFNDTNLSGCLYPAMQNVHTALVSLGLDKQVTVTTAHSLAVLESSYPPSSGAFRKDLKACINQILNFHARTGSSLLINAYPYFAYKADPKKISLDYVLFQPNQGVLDPVSNLRYDNMLFAQIDAVYAALNAMGYKKMAVQISETGWPSKGDENEAGATPDNASKYNGNLINLVSQKKGTPMQPNSNLDVFVFALFNENMKPGPASERNYGLFKPDATPAYHLQFTANTTPPGTPSSPTATGAGAGAGAGTASSNDTASTPYLSISSTTGELHFIGQALFSACLSLIVLFFAN